MHMGIPAAMLPLAVAAITLSFPAYSCETLSTADATCSQEIRSVWMLGDEPCSLPGYYDSDSGIEIRRDLLVGYEEPLRPIMVRRIAKFPAAWSVSIAINIVEPAHDRSRRARLAEMLSAIDVEHVLDPVRELAADDVHGQIQLPAVRRRPCVEVADVGGGVRDHRGRVEMVRCPCDGRSQHAGNEQHNGYPDSALSRCIRLLISYETGR